MKEILEQLIQRKPLTPKQMSAVIKQCIHSELQDAQIAAFLALMRAKGETPEELSVAAQTMAAASHTIDLGNDLIDIVGTGGDGKNTFNVSTICSFVAAAAGAKVAKHGNHSASSRSGSADLLLEAGFKLDLSDKALQSCMKQCNMVFLYAPHFHQQLTTLRTVRKSLGIRTLFNLIGPLLNPANVKKQVIGVCKKELMQTLAYVLVSLGSERVLMIHSKDHLDEISIAAKTDVLEYHHGKFHSWTLDPNEYGCQHSALDDVIITSPTQSLNLAKSVFAGEKGAARDMIILNAAAALYVAGICESIATGVQKAADTIDSGRAQNLFTTLCSMTKANYE